MGLPSVPVTWPIGCGLNFQGIYDILKNEAVLYKADKIIKLGENGVFGPELEGEISGFNLSSLRDEIELIQGAGNEFDMEAISCGKLSPVFFGSALSDFGTTQFLRHFLDMSPAPGPRKTTDGFVNPGDDFFSGFIFKIQANMNPAHRDRLAFFRICSGTFERGMTVKLSRTGKEMKLAQSTMLMANHRENIEEAIAGDIIGIYDTGKLSDRRHSFHQKRDAVLLNLFPPFLRNSFALVTPKRYHEGQAVSKGSFSAGAGRSYPGIPQRI